MSILNENERVLGLAERIFNQRKIGESVSLEIKDYKLMIDSYVENKSITENKADKLIELIECEYAQLNIKYEELKNMIIE